MVKKSNIKARPVLEPLKVSFVTKYTPKLNLKLIPFFGLPELNSKKIESNKSQKK